MQTELENMAQLKTLSFRDPSRQRQPAVTHPRYLYVQARPGSCTISIAFYYVLPW